MTAPATDKPTEATIECPLCDYDLRGLVDPRCPECGYAFEWAELTDPARRRHKYLFEHHPERNKWSFIRTMMGQLRPRKFWAELLPSQPSRPKRLLLYALVIVVSALPPIVLPPATTLHYTWMQMAASRRQWTATLQSNPNAVASWFSAAATMPTQQALDHLAPAPSWRTAFVNQVAQHVLKQQLQLFGVVLLWPALTLATTMIFIVSMRRARVRRIHFVRCVIYASDSILWANIVLTCLFTLQLAQYLMGVSWSANTDGIMFCAIGLAIVAFAYRLCIAFRKYLRFDHPISTILSTQIIVALTIALFIVLASM